MTGTSIFWTIISTLVVVPGALWYFTAEPGWALGWAFLIIFGAAG
jgi:hypothetical protein